jgi:hypothetical protein
MLTHQTVTKLGDLGLSAMAAALTDQLAIPGPWSDLAFEDRLGLLVDREAVTWEFPARSEGLEPPTF